MSLLKANAVQLGQSATATQNFTIATPTTPNGTLKISRGNAGATTEDILSIDAASGVTGKIGLSAFSSIQSILEKITTTATASTGTVQFDAMSQSVLYHTSSATGNWTLNIRGNSSTTFNSLLSVGQTMSLIFMNTNGGTAYYPTGFTIDGTAVTVKWQNANVPSFGNINSIDSYSYSIIKTASSTYTVLGTQVRFA